MSQNIARAGVVVVCGVFLGGEVERRGNNIGLISNDET